MDRIEILFGGGKSRIVRLTCDELPPPPPTLPLLMLLQPTERKATSETAIQSADDRGIGKTP
jgi:hypothetical protein